jgi:hypothetical protein
MNPRPSRDEQYLGFASARWTTVVHDGSPDHLAVLTTAARTIRGIGTDSLLPGGRSDFFCPLSRTIRSLDLTVSDGVGSSSSSWEPRSHPLGRDLRVLRVNRSPGASHTT